MDLHVSSIRNWCDNFKLPMVKKTMLVVVEVIDRKNLSSRPMMHETKA
jgi:hypothetical protein